MKFSHWRRNNFPKCSQLKLTSNQVFLNNSFLFVSFLRFTFPWLETFSKIRRFQETFTENALKYYHFFIDNLLSYYCGEKWTSGSKCGLVKHFAQSRQKAQATCIIFRQRDTKKIYPTYNKLFLAKFLIKNEVVHSKLVGRVQVCGVKNLSVWISVK